MAEINLRELGLAIAKEARRDAGKRGTGSMVDPQLAYSLAQEVAEFYWDPKADFTFEEALERGLRELHILKAQRRNYEWIMGSYFGTRGNHKKRRMKRGTRGRVKPRSSRKPGELTTETEKSGQLAWRMP